MNWDWNSTFYLFIKDRASEFFLYFPLIFRFSQFSHLNLQWVGKDSLFNIFFFQPEVSSNFRISGAFILTIKIYLNNFSDPFARYHFQKFDFLQSSKFSSFWNFPFFRFEILIQITKFQFLSFGEPFKFFSWPNLAFYFDMILILSKYVELNISKMYND